MDNKKLKLNPYLKFDGRCEEAFNLYKKVFGSEFSGDGIMRFGDVPPQEDMPEMAGEVNNRVMHVALPVGDDTLMGCDIMPGMENNEGGKNFRLGDNCIISISPGSREEADRIYAELSEGGRQNHPMQDQFWGDYFGMLVDKFGNEWMISYSEKSTF